MRTAHVLFKSEVAGTLTQWDDGSFSFEYRDEWTANSTKPSISYTLPKSQRSFRSPYLFPFFFGLIPEGSNKEYIARFHRLDGDDYFGILLRVAATDCIGAVQIKAA